MINGGIFDLDNKEAEYKELKKTTQEEGFWQQSNASSMIKKFNSLKETVEK